MPCKVEDVAAGGSTESLPAFPGAVQDGGVACRSCTAARRSCKDTRRRRDVTWNERRMTLRSRPAGPPGSPVAGRVVRATGTARQSHCPGRRRPQRERSGAVHDVRATGQAGCATGDKLRVQSPASACQSRSDRLAGLARSAHDPPGRADRALHAHRPDAHVRLSPRRARAVPGPRPLLGDLPAHRAHQAHRGAHGGARLRRRRARDLPRARARGRPSSRTTRPAPTRATPTRSASPSRPTTPTRAPALALPRGLARTAPASSARWASASAGTSPSARR